LEHSSGKVVKIGETRVSPEKRTQDYIKTYKLKGFTLAKTYEVPVSERQEIEKYAHKKLQREDKLLSGVEGAKELFTANLDEAKAAVEEAISKNELAANLERERKLEEDRRQAAIEAASENIIKSGNHTEWKKNYEKIIQDFENAKIHKYYQYLTYPDVRSVQWFVGSAYFLRWLDSGDTADRKDALSIIEKLSRTDGDFREEAISFLSAYERDVKKAEDKRLSKLKKEYQEKWVWRMVWVCLAVALVIIAIYPPSIH
jgi:rubrerythrin